MIVKYVHVTTFCLDHYCFLETDKVIKRLAMVMWTDVFGQPIFCHGSSISKKTEMYQLALYF